MSTESPPPTFGEQLRAARKRAGLTQDEAAKLFGVSKSLWRQWEDGRSEPDTDATVITQEKAVCLLAQSFPERLKAVRKFAKLSQTQAAKAIGVSYGTLWHWENGSRTPPTNAERLTKERLLQFLEQVPIRKNT
jgi:transcriptional regulator with XRE-family HTH domain